MNKKEFIVEESEPNEIIISKIDDYLMDMRANIFEKLMNRDKIRLDKIIISFEMLED